jgi:hypothetical protein
VSAVAVTGSVTAGWVAGGLARRVSVRTGVCDAEAFGPLPGDEFIAHPMVEWTRGVTVQAPVERVWPGLAQMGYGRGGWYTTQWVDLFANRWVFGVRHPFPASAGRLLPEYQQVAVGDLICDGPDYASYFRVLRVDPQRAVVYRSIRHPRHGSPIDVTDPQAPQRAEQQLREAGTYIDFTWPAGAAPGVPGPHHSCVGPPGLGQDLVAGWWQLIGGLGAVPRCLVWDGEGVIGRWRAGRPAAHDRGPGIPRGLGGPAGGDRLWSCMGRSFDVPLEHGQHPCLHNPDARDVEPIDDEAFQPLRAEGLVAADDQACAPVRQLVQQEAPESLHVGRWPWLLQIKGAEQQVAIWSLYPSSPKKRSGSSAATL